MFKINESLEISNIEGIGNLARQFSIACMDLKRNPYIMLASNTSKFDTEFAKFMDQIGRIEVCFHFTPWLYYILLYVIILMFF